MTRQLTLFATLALIVTLLGWPSDEAAAAPGEAISPGTVRVDASFESVGVVWTVDGDQDLDSTMTLEFREAGTTEWRPAAPAMRAYPSIIVDGTPLGLDQWGASALFLTPATPYELRLTITDPDGGGQTQVVSATTRSWPQADSTGRDIFVAPGDAGGAGTSDDPFRGLQTAADAARPGDTFTVATGTYSPFQILTSGSDGHPISFVAGGNVVIDGAGTDRGVVTIGEYDRNTSHVIIDGFVISNGQWGIDAQNTQDILITGNTIQNVDNGIVNRRDNGVEARQTICDNAITGRTAWPQPGVIPSEEGIDLNGTGNVVCHNTVRYFGDCISVVPSTSDSYGQDVFGNDTAFCVDDGIEIDYNQANARVWQNRVTNARMGVSVQPIAGGPAYIFRNEFFNLESAPIKMHNDTTGFIVVHNTGVKVGDGYSDNGAMWRNAILRNNLFIGTRYAFEFTTVRDEGFRDFDYDAWGTTGEDSPGGPWFKWENVRYDRIGDLPTGVEDHGVEISLLELVGAALPDDWDVAVEPGVADLRLAAGASAMNAGVPLDNLNDGVTIVDRPDMGAFEYGFALPEYGPRVAGVGSRFVDVPPGALFFSEIEWLADGGITKGCNPPINDMFCPNDPVTRGQMAAFLNRALHLPASGNDVFSDDNTSVFQADINALAASGITKGCNPPTQRHVLPRSDGDPWADGGVPQPGTRSPRRCPRRVQ